MKQIGYIQSSSFKTPIYATRYNLKKAYMSNIRLGNQVLIDYLGSLMWINVKQEWITKFN